jgi:Fe-S oxidoreductase
MAVGERVLFPAVREAISGDNSAMIAAPGTSCRHQILDGTGVHARHPVQMLAEHLMD